MDSNEPYPRFLEGAVRDALADTPVVVIQGARQVGKSTLAQLVAGGFADVRQVKFDDPATLAVAESDPAFFVTQAGQGLLVVDEAQRAPGLILPLKASVDRDRRPGRFLLTGSVRARLDSAGWPGTGRVVPLAMYGLTVGELEHRRGAAAAVDRLFSDKDPAVGTFEPAPNLVDYLDHAIRGGFPDAVGLSDFARSTWFEGYVDQMIRHDVADLAEVRSPAGLAALLRAVALNTAGLPSLATLADAASLDHRTAKGYLDLLEDLRIIERIPAWTTNRLSRMVKTPKYYILDPGLAAHLAGDTRSGTLRSNDRLGRLTDTFVLAQLRPLLKLATPSVIAHHLRDGNQTREVDLVLESAAGQVVGIEIKAASTVAPSDARHLAWLRDHLGPAFHRGIVLHTGATGYPLGERLWALPIAALWQ